MEERLNKEVEKDIGKTFEEQDLLLRSTWEYNRERKTVKENKIK